MVFKSQEWNHSIKDTSNKHALTGVFLQPPAKGLLTSILQDTIDLYNQFIQKYWGWANVSRKLFGLGKGVGRQCGELGKREHPV
jgi:hypothetical protein